MTSISRATKLQQVQKPYFTACAVLAVAGALAFALGPKGQVNWVGTLLVSLVPLVDAMRHRMTFKYHDEYGQSVILKAAAAGFAGVMAILLGLALLSAAMDNVSFSSGLIAGLFAGAYLGFLAVQKALFRKDAQEE